ncbi:MAG TPA: hypothetical protein VMR02_08090 [Terracidiphilus sp.]|nr:hypothetical protein [Terracidiphilus sp.]
MRHDRSCHLRLSWCQPEIEYLSSALQRDIRLRASKEGLGRLSRSVDPPSSYRPGSAERRVVGRGSHPLDRALLTLAFGLPGEPYDSLAGWPLGKRNAALVRLHRVCFGTAFTGWVACPRCRERLEFSFDARPLLEQQAEAESLTINGRTFRPLTSGDLAKIVGETDERAAAQHLLRQCCTESCEFTEAELDSIGDLLGAADPLAETLLDFACVACSHRWKEPLDVALWL